MSLTLADLKSALSRKLHGTSINKIEGFYQLAAEAAGNLMAILDPEETRRISQITNAVHNSVYDYPLPTDFKKIIDLRPQANRNLNDNFSRSASEDFDLYKSDNTLDIKYDAGARSIRISKALNPVPATINGLDGLTDNGTWVATASASNLAVNTLDYISGSASLSFDLASGAAGATGYIENSTMSQVDLTDHDEKGTLFLWAYFPTASVITNVILRWGNDTSNYWSRTATTAQDGTAFKTGWNLLSFRWNGATETGTVAPATIDYLRITVTYDGTATSGVKMDSVVSSIGKIFELEYYSKYLFRNSSGTYLETPTSDTDIVNLDYDGFNILTYEIGELLAQELQGQDGSFDKNFFFDKLHGDGTERNPGLYKQYKDNHPSESMPIKKYYYRIR